MATLLIKGEPGREHRWRADILLTDEHSASSYGMPVAVVDGIAYGPGDHCESLYPENEISFMFADSTMGDDVRVIAYNHQRDDFHHPLVERFCGPI